LAELVNIGPQHKQFAPKIQALTQRVSEHIEFEEAELFEEARKVLSEYRLEELGLEMEQRRKLLQITAA
jgi:hemerythrin-like domain-containing protein